MESHADYRADALETAETLLAITKVLTQLSPLRYRLQEACEVLSDSLDGCRVAVIELDPKTNGLAITAITGPGNVPRDLIWPADDVSPKFREVLDTGTTVVIDYTQMGPSERARRAAALYQGEVVLFAPITRGPQIFGSLSIDAPSGRMEFTERHRSLAEAAASQVAVAIENERLYEWERARRKSVEALKDISELATSTLDPKEVARLGTQFIAERLAVDYIMLWSLDDAREKLVPIAGSGFPAGFLDEFGEGVELDQPYEICRVQQSGEVVRHRDAGDVSEPVREVYRRYGIRLGAMLIVPLRSQRDVFGALVLVWKSPQVLDDAEVDYYRSVVNALARASDNARLFQESSKAAEYAEALNRIDAIVHSTLDFDSIVRRAIEEATKAVGLDGTAIHLRDERKWLFKYSYGIPYDLASLRATDEMVPLSTRVRETGQPIVLRDASSDPRANRELMSRFGINALMGLPLMVRGEVVGVLFSGCFGRTDVLSARQIGFMTKVASTLSLALENARLYEAEHRIAETLQEALLALPDSIRGLDFAHAYRSATDVARVGGDFYDLFEIEHDLIAIMIGDVAGKGLDSAVLTSLIKNTIRAHASEPGVSPARILGQANAIVFRQTPSEVFVTVFFGILDCAMGSLRYVNAAHPAPIVCGPSGSCRTLVPTATLLGAFPDTEFEDVETTIGLDDAVFLYTDGVTEARDDGRLYGEKRLLNVVCKASEGRPADIIDRVVAGVIDFSDGRLTDDTAILCIRRHPGDCP